MISKEENKRISKLLSYVLRHHPEHLGIELDSNGWTDVATLIIQLNKHKTAIDLAALQHIVATNEKKRFSFNEDGSRIRASQGHSINIELSYEPRTPPPLLYHGTPEKNVPLIREKGLLKMSRHHVHLSADQETALLVGGRHGKAIVLTIQSLAMHEAGHSFYFSDNAVWLTEHVPPEFIMIRTIYG